MGAVLVLDECDGVHSAENDPSDAPTDSRDAPASLVRSSGKPEAMPLSPNGADDALCASESPGSGRDGEPALVSVANRIPALSRPSPFHRRALEAAACTSSDPAHTAALGSAASALC